MERMGEEWQRKREKKGTSPPFAGAPSVGCGWRRGCAFGASIFVDSIFVVIFGHAVIWGCFVQ